MGVMNMSTATSYATFEVPRLFGFSRLGADLSGGAWKGCDSPTRKPEPPVAYALTFGSNGEAHLDDQDRHNPAFVGRFPRACAP